MNGNIKYYDSEKKFGFITRSDDGGEIYFHFNQVKDDSVRLGKGKPVEFEIRESNKKSGQFYAVDVRNPSDYTHEKFSIEKESDRFIRPKEFLHQWGFIVLDDTENDDGNKSAGALHDLKEMALKESWSFETPTSNSSSYPILKNYLRYTFYRLYKEKKIKEAQHEGQQWAAFDTGLVNNLYDPIYALFKKNTYDLPPWRFDSFCCANIGQSGRKLASLFDPLPEPPKYFYNAKDVVIDPDATLLPRYDHIIDDGVERNRFPVQFLKDNTPKGMVWKDPSNLNAKDRTEYLKEFVEKIREDYRCYRDIKRRIDDAIDLAMKRARWNYKTAIPHYFPRNNSMSLLLPIALVDDDKVDIALVVDRTPAGGYSGETILKLSWAYQNARLVCRPDSDWLSPELIFMDHENSDDDDNEEEISEDSELII